MELQNDNSDEQPIEYEEIVKKSKNNEKQYAVNIKPMERSFYGRVEKSVLNVGQNNTQSLNETNEELLE